MLLNCYFRRVTIRWGPVAFLALGLQLIATFAPLGPDAVRRVFFVSSYLLLLSFAVANLRRPGLLLMGVGLLLNFLAIVSNGGLMPVTPDTLERVGPPPENVSLGEWVPHTKDVLLERADTRLWLLTDVLAWKNPTRVSAFSIGDVIIAAGLLVTLGELLLPRMRRSSPPAYPSDRLSSP